MILAAFVAALSSLIGPLGLTTNAAIPTQTRPAQCALAINGKNIREFNDPDRAVRLSVNDVVRLSAQSSEPTSETRIFVDLPIGPSIPVQTIAHRPARQFTDSLRVSDISNVGVGWYHLEVNSGPCRGSFWVQVYGRSPFTTIIGLGATAVLLVGVVLLVLAVRRRPRRMVVGATAGLLIGIALCVLAQQFAIVAFTAIALTAFLGGGAATGAGATRSPQTRSTPSDSTWSGASPAPLPSPNSPGPMAAPPDSPSDPPRRAHARIECDEAVVVHSPLDVIVGLSPTAVRGVVGPVLVRPPSSVGDYELVVQLVADGFDLALGETWRKSMIVTAAAPYPHVVFRVLAPATASISHGFALNVLYSVDSQTIGLGTRYVRVVDTVDDLARVVPDVDRPPVGSLGVPTSDQPADLTVSILRGNSPGALLWSFQSPHGTFDKPGKSSIGEEPNVFARTVIATVAAHEGKPTLALGLRGIGRTIADKVPAEMWAAIATVSAAAAPRNPTVLVLSEEAYVPWELATMPQPLDAAITNTLGAQVTMGRWVLATHQPSLPPPTSLRFREMVVVSGRYEQPGWSRLEHAEAEAAALIDRYHAIDVDAVTADVANCLIGKPRADIVHFSLHGKYDPGSAKQGLVLIDGGVIDPLVVKGGALADAPLVFLNACQVGTGQETLGDYAGLAESFLYAGASAVVAPLWSIDDEIASALAERFYARAFAGDTLASIVRNERAGFGQGDNANSSTLMAFQFFGHPAMRLEV